ncbi:MAG: MATE family efflux transporter, partial [Polaromonas sp. 28-63-22]
MGFSGHSSSVHRQKRQGPDLQAGERTDTVCQATIAYGVADTVIAGRYSDEALAALSVGSAFYISVYVGLIGVVQALLPRWAELHGAARHRELGWSLRQSLYLSGFIVAAGMAALLFPAPLLFSTFNQSLGKPLLVTWLQVGALGVKIPLSIWLVAGGGGVEPMGAVGCAWATLAVNYLLLALAFVLLRTQSLYRPYGLWRKIERPHWTEIGGFARLGVPAGLAYLVEVTSFTLMAIFIARLGVVGAASHQIAASVATVLYMVPLSMAIACSARVSFWLGAGHAQRAKDTVLLGLKLTAGYAVFLGFAVYLGRRLIPVWYSETPEIQVAAATLLAWVAFYHVADAGQAVSAFMLRCYRITIAPLAVYGVGLWGVGLYGGYLLTYKGF